MIGADVQDTLSPFDSEDALEVGPWVDGRRGMKGYLAELPVSRFGLHVVGA